MKKNITKEQIVETALELMRDRDESRELNLREIARVLGCAHTNLYNYFPSYNDLLWETHAALMEIFMDMLTKKLKASSNAESRLTGFFEAFADIYLDNKGWFRLAWHKDIGGERPQRDVEVIESTNKALNRYLSEIWKELSGESPDMEETKRVLHNTHCYIVGEISNYLRGRVFIENEAKLKKYITHEATCMFKLCLSGGMM